MHQGNEEEIGGRTKFEKEKTMPSATIRLTFLGGRDFLVNPYLRVSQALYENKNYNLLSSVTVSGVID